MTIWAWMTCPHRRTRCLHGDEILLTMDLMGHIKRQACLDCGRYLDGGLPNVCTYTGKPH